MKAKIHLKNHCRICQSENLKKILTLPQMPFTDEFILQEELGREFKADIPIHLCLDCYTVQTQHDVDVTDYYEDYQYSVGTSKTASKFMETLAKSLIDKYFIEDKIKVLEIGSGDGGQLIPFQAMGGKVLGYEPSSYLTKIAEDQGIKTIQGLFNESSIEKLPEDFKKVDIVLLSYTFDHLPDPVNFLETVREILNPEKGILVVEVHDLEKIFDRREYCLFEHEHSIYLTSSTAQSLMERMGYVMIDFNIVPESIRRANSLLFVATPKGSIFANQALPKVELDNFEELNFYETQVQKIYQGIQNLDDYLEKNSQKGKKIAGYGAGGRGVMTLAAMNKAHYLEYLVDKKPKGQGIYCPKSEVPVFGIEKLQESPVDYIIVFSFGYLKEIQEDLQKFGYSSEQLHSMLDVLDGREM